MMQVLLSIQSLLTDPFCDVCMEPDIGELYLTDKASFEAVARYSKYGRYTTVGNFALFITTYMSCAGLGWRIRNIAVQHLDTFYP